MALSAISGMAGNSCSVNKSTVTVSPHTDRLSKADLFKVYLSVDREVIKEANSAGASLKGLGVVKLDDLLTELIHTDLSDADVDVAASSLQGLGILKELVKGIRNTAPVPVANLTNKVINNAANAAAAGMTPTRDSISALKSISGQFAKSFVYAFIPDDANELSANPEVKRKSDEQKKALDKMASKMNFQPDYLKKHLRNLIVRGYRKNPEQIIHDLANKTEKEFTFSTKELKGLGAFDLNSLVDFTSDLNSKINEIGVFFDTSNIPTTQDWNTIIPAKDNVTKDPAYEKENFWTSTAGILTIIGGTAVVGGGTYYLATN